MADERLRALERRWRQGGGTLAHADLLRERLRAGRLELGLLGLAAHLGHAGARAALGSRAPEEADRAGWPDGWEEEAARLVEGGGADDRIWFPGNPWPAGHRLEELSWVGRLVPETGLWFDLHLKTVAYYAETRGGDEDQDDNEDEDDDDSGDWQAKIVWGNYHACTLSSNNWHYGGWRVGTAEEPLDLETLGSAAYRVDEVPPEEHDDMAFHVYLLGHDSAADHRIVLTPVGGGAHRLEWSGRLAQTYVGDDEFRYRFYARASRVTFGGFQVPRALSDAEARAAFAPLVTSAAPYALRERRGERWFVPKPPKSR